MRFEPCKEGKLKVTLTREDMASQGITYRLMDYGDPRTRRLISRILGTARQRGLFFYHDQSKLIIQLFPTTEGGCTIVFSVLPADEPMPRHESSGGISTFSFGGLDTLGRAAVSLREKKLLPDGGRFCRCSLYRLEREYRIVCRLRQPSQCPPPCRGELLRYGRFCAGGEIAAAYCEEHGTLLASGDALKKMARCWGSPEESD